MANSREKGDLLPSISNAEWEVMKPLWEKGPMAARDVYAALPEGHGWAYKTVKTLLSRLVAKGALDYEEIGNSYLYRAVYSRDQITRKEMRKFIDRVTDGALGPVLAHFVKERNLSEKEIARLRQLLDEKEHQAKSKSKKGKS